MDQQIAKEQVLVGKKRVNKRPRVDQTRQMPPTLSASNRWTRNRMLLIGLVALIVVIAATGWWYHSTHRANEVADTGARKRKHSPPDDPRLTFATPFFNVRPEVKYVGDEACAGCHEGHAKSYHQHPMGRSLEPIAAATAVE